MLSYRHAFHAGNHADVLKHSVMIHCLQHLLKKEKSFHYVDTHAGAGLYELTTGYADRIQEWRHGIGKIYNETSPLPALLENYRSIISSFNPKPELEFYPGSPLIAKQMLRNHDQLRLHELHRTDFDILHSHSAADPRILLQKKDGLRGLIKCFPPPSKRGIALIDPPYERKDDYHVLPFAIDDALFKFASAMILVWYPMLENELFHDLKSSLSQLPGDSWLNVELTVRGPDTGGLYGSGMWVINPPWNLPKLLEDAKPTVLELLSETNDASMEFNYLIP